MQQFTFFAPEVDRAVQHLYSLFVDFANELEYQSQGLGCFFTIVLDALTPHYIRPPRKVRLGVKRLNKLLIDFENAVISTRAQGRYMIGNTWRYLDGTYLIPNRFARQVDRAVAVLLDIETYRRHNNYNV